MPIEIRETVRVLNQRQFGEIAFGVMDHVFGIHNDLGRFCDEDVYQKELVHLLGQRASDKVWIKVRHGGFCKTYFMDILVNQGAIFELKVVNQLAAEHRVQLLNYLLLTESRHGKLVNFRPDRVEHEFINTTLTRADRTRFAVVDSEWKDTGPRASEVRRFLVECLQDWGTCLELGLYEEAATYVLGGEECVLREIAIVNDGRRLGCQKVRLVDDHTILKITGLHADRNGYRSHITKFINHTELDHVMWVNVTLHQVTFSTVSKS